MWPAAVVGGTAPKLLEQFLRGFAKLRISWVAYLHMCAGCMQDEAQLWGLGCLLELGFLPGAKPLPPFLDFFEVSPLLDEPFLHFRISQLRQGVR